MDEFASEKEILIKAHEENMAATRKRQFEEEKELKRKHFEKTLELEKEFDANLTRLMKKYSPQNLQQTVNHLDDRLYTSERQESKRTGKITWTD